MTLIERLKAAQGVSPAIRKGYCQGCPYDWGSPATEMAYNLGCLPSVAEVNTACNGTAAWACHSESDKVCCGYAASGGDIDLPLLNIPGIHAPALLSALDGGAK